MNMHYGKFANNKEFFLPIRVYVEDTDAGGIVFYANYLKYLERARTEMVRSLGYEVRAGLSDGINFVVHHLDIRYLASARLDDLVVSSARLTEMRGGRLQFVQTVVLPEPASPTSLDAVNCVIRGQGLKLVSALVTVACVSTHHHRPIRLPTPMKQVLEPCLVSEENGRIQTEHG